MSLISDGIEAMFGGMAILTVVVCISVFAMLTKTPWSANANAHPQATWVSEAHEGGVSKSGRIWSNDEWTAAMKGTTELGKWKRVALVEDPDRPIYVLVTDRLPDAARSDIDLSKGATLLLGGDELLQRGRFNVTIQDAR